MAGSLNVLSGTFAGRYTIERELGRGATATVYLARDTQRGRSVAIKLLRPELAQSVGSERFLREIKVNEQLHHPHIVPVLDSGEVDGQLYFVLPQMEGGSLRQMLEREKQLPIDTAIAITRTIADALDYAHGQGLIHRDVKPENILFTSGQACLADFGIARAIERAIDESTTSTGLVRGTPAYMSPEQASGSMQYDGRTDQYSLALVLYEMLAGVPAFIGPTPESVIAMRFQHKPRELRVYRPTVGTAVHTVIDKALSVSKADRYGTAAEFVAAVEAAARMPIVESRSSGALATLGRPRVAVPALLVLAGAVALLVAALMPTSTPPAGIPDGDPRRIAVLYLDNLSPNTLPSYVAAGLTEDLIDQLGVVQALHVISPNGVRPFRDGVLPVDSVARLLKVGTIVSGSVARSGNTMRVTVRLIDGSTSRQLYSQVIAEPWSDVFTLQTRLAEQVAFFLRQRLGEAIAIQRHRASTRSYAAWELVQQASEATRLGLAAGILRADSTPRHFLLADSLYARAAALDPTWMFPVYRRSRIALALAVHAPMYVDSAGAGSALPSLPERRTRWIRRSLAFANDALRKNDTSAAALGVRGEALFMLMNTGGGPVDSIAPLARADLQRAVELEPDNASAWATLAQLARFEGRFADASAAARKAYESDAYFEVPRIVSIGFFAALHAGEIEQARTWCAMGLDRYPGDPRFTECRLTILGWTGRTRADVAAARRLVSGIETRDTLRMLAPSWGYRRLMVSAVAARAGMRDSARSLLLEVVGQQAQDPARRGSAMTEAYVHLLLGEPDSALARLSGHLRQSPQNRPQIAAHPWFRDLRDDPRFAALAAPQPLPARP
jgi:TolB-like protein/tRNA A-37 threonylcarbamoyl transferase component Bud32